VSLTSSNESTEAVCFWPVASPDTLIGRHWTEVRSKSTLGMKGWRPIPGCSIRSCGGGLACGQPLLSVPSAMESSRAETLNRPVTRQHAPSVSERLRRAQPAIISAPGRGKQQHRQRCGSLVPHGLPTAKTLLGPQRFPGRSAPSNLSTGDRTQALRQSSEPAVGGDASPLTAKYPKRDWWPAPATLALGPPVFHGRASPRLCRLRYESMKVSWPRRFLAAAGADSRGRVLSRSWPVALGKHDSTNLTLHGHGAHC